MSEPAGTTLQDEVQQLRAQVRDLQAQLSQRESTRRRRKRYAADRYDRGEESFRENEPAGGDATNVARDLPVRLMDEATKFVRGLTFAYMEQLRVAADALNAFAGEVSTRNRPRLRSQASFRYSGRPLPVGCPSTRVCPPFVAIAIPSG